MKNIVPFPNCPIPTRRVSSVADNHRKQVTPREIVAEQVCHYSIPSVQAKGTGTWEPGNTIDSNKWVIVSPSVLISRLNPRKNTICVAHPEKETTVASTEFVVLSTKNYTDNYYLKYVLETPDVTKSLSAMTTSATRSHQRVSPKDIAKIQIPWPSAARRHDTVTYLGRETAEIDAFIADQERLIELLEERRTATITHAVTKGLNPDAPMKDSGVEWVGSIPAPWDIKRLSWLFGIISSGTTPPIQTSEYFNGEVNWVTTSELRETSITHTDRTISRKALTEFPSLRLYGPGTLVIAMYGATIGRLGILETSATTNQACCAFSEPIGTSPKFVFYMLLAAREHLMVLADGGGQPNINQEKLRSLRIPQPDHLEQTRIANFLDGELAEIDAAVADAREVIGLLRERRAALISAAVTGQIDVTQQARSVVDQSMDDEVWV